MRLYADVPARRLRQIVADATVLVWVLVWIGVGRSIHATAVDSAAGAVRLRSGGQEFSSSMRDAAERVQRVPLVGDQLRTPFERAADTGTSFAQAGQDLQHGLDRLGLLLGLVVAALAIAIVVLPWLMVRLRYGQRVRQARALEAFTDPQVRAMAVALRLDPPSLGLLPAAAVDAVAIAPVADDDPVTPASGTPPQV